MEFLTQSEAMEIVKSVNIATRKLGYKPYNDITVVSGAGDDKDKYAVTGTCPLCGKVVDLDKSSCELENITNPNTNETIPVNSCPHCKISRDEQESKEPKRKLNALVMGRVNQILEDKFGAKLICTKINLFNEPEELVTFKKGDEKYRAKLKTIMLYSDNLFEDIDDEYRDGDESIFSYYEEDFICENKHTGEKYSIEDFLLNKERDGVNFVNEETESEETVETETVSEEVVEQTETTEPEVEETSTEEVTSETEQKKEPHVDFTVTDETEITAESVESYEPETEITEEVTEPVVEETESEETVETETVSEEVIEQTETTEPEVEVEESTEETETTVETDEIEITEDDLFGSSGSETIEIESESIKEQDETVETDKTSEETDEITIDSDNSTGFGNFFEGFNLFGSNKEKEEFKTEETSDDESDEITIESDGSVSNGDTNPFSEASEVETKEEKTDDSKISPITSEARKFNSETEEKVEISSVTESFTTEDESEEITIEVEPTNKTTSSKSEKTSTADDIGTNHTDKIGDERRQIYENDKKWYNNPVYFGDDNENFNELMDEVDLVNEFKESSLGKVIYEVCKRTNIQAQFTINEDTFEIPVVDFESGVRVVCIDCDKVAQMKVNLALMERSLQFAYNLPKGETYRKIYLYSDALSSKARIKATTKNLIKIVNRDKFDGRRILTLAGNYTLFYTDSIPVIRSFEEENSSYPQGKPCTKEIGIIALRHKSGKHEQFTAKDFMNYLNKNYKMDMKNHNLYMVATARYIVKPEAARKVVKYQITDYCELADSILKDGLDHIIGAIMKEHKANNTVKDPRYLGTDFSEYKAEFEFEFDPSVIPSPSLEIWGDNNDLFRFPDSFEDGQGKCYIRMPEYRANQTDGYRKDPRLFLPIPFSKLFRVDIEKAGVNVLNDNARRKFIEQLGFVESYYPRMKRFILNPVKVMKLEFTSSVLTMTKVDLNKFFSGNGVYDGGYDNILLQKFINSSNMDEKTKNMMSYMALSKMLKS